MYRADHRNGLKYNGSLNDEYEILENFPLNRRACEAARLLKKRAQKNKINVIIVMD